LETLICKSKRGLSKVLIVGIVIAIIVIAAVAAYAISAQNPNPSASPQPTATPTEAPTTEPSNAEPTATAPASTTEPSPTATSTASATAPPNVSGASSLQYSESATSNGQSLGSYTYYGKNIGTPNFMMRIEFTDTDGNQTIYIINGQLQKAWIFADNEWTDASEVYTMQYNTWNTLWQGYVGALAAWSGAGDYTYSVGGDSVRIYGISVNPTLADSLFSHS